MDEFKYDLSVNPDRQVKLKGQVLPLRPAAYAAGLGGDHGPLFCGDKKNMFSIGLTH